MENARPRVAIDDGCHDAVSLEADLAVILEATGLRVRAIDAIVRFWLSRRMLLATFWLPYHDIVLALRESR